MPTARKKSALRLNHAALPQLRLRVSRIPVIVIVNRMKNAMDQIY